MTVKLSFTYISCIQYYATRLFKVAAKHLPEVHGYADDTQLYISFKPNTEQSQECAMRSMQSCIADMRAWMVSNQLMINDSKTEFLIIGSRVQLSKVTIDSINVGHSSIKPSAMRNLGAWSDQHMSMEVHIGKTCSKAFYAIRQIRKLLSVESTRTLAHAFVISVF